MFKFPSYASFVAVMGYSPASPTVVDRGGTSIWRISANDNLCRFSEDDNIRVTACYTRNGDIGYVWNIGDDSGWSGPFESFDEAMDDADANVFGG